MISLRRGATLAAAIGVAAIVLAGCAPSVAPNAAPSSAPSATPTPTPTQPVNPQVVFGGDCSQVAPLAIVQAAQPGVTLLSATAPTNLYDFPLIQAGGLECQWYDGKKSTGFTISVLPNAAAAFSHYSASLSRFDDSTRGIKNVPHYGDKSFTQCVGEDDPAYGCDIDFLAGSVWVSLRQNLTVIKNPYPESASFKALLNQLVTSARAVTAPATWHPPTDGTTVPASCADAFSNATLKQDTQTTLTLNPDALVDGQQDGAAITASGSLECQWGQNTSPGRDTVQLYVVPGSAWGWNGDAVPAAASETTLAPQSGLGDAAVAGCKSDYCDVFVRSGQTWFQVTEIRASSSSSLAQTLALARSFLATLTS